MSKLDQLLGCLCGCALFAAAAIIFGACAGWGSTEAIICYVGFVAFGGLSVLAYKWWKDEKEQDKDNADI